VPRLLFELLILLAAVVVVAALFRFVPAAPRHRLRRNVILFCLVALLVAAAQPFRWFGLEVVARRLETAGDVLRWLLYINLAGLLVFELFLRATRLRMADIVQDLLLGVAYVVVIFWFIHRAGVDLTSIVATSAVVTAVIGLSLQSTLGNLVGGLALQVDGSFQEGDWLELESKVQGRVKKIRWRHTVIETRDWDTLIVPNSQLLAQTLKVLGKREGQPTQHRMWVYFNVDFRYAPGEVIRVVNEALQSAPIPGAAPEPAPHAICFDFAKDHRDTFGYYAVRYWLTDLARDDPTSSMVRERLYSALKRAQIPLAKPAQAIFLSHDDAGRAERQHSRDVEAKRQALDKVELFSQLSDHERTRLAETARWSPFSPGEVITRQGAKAHWLYVLVSGRAQVRVESEGGSDREVAELVAPSFFGEMALMTGEPREATVIARTDVTCVRVDKNDFQEVLHQRPAMAHAISQVLAKRRVELLAARDDLDVSERSSRLITESGQILSKIRQFFALDSQGGPTRHS
jgi:CRP-like cAMP-binding protein/small-conductance mechanosensitive channel